MKEVDDVELKLIYGGDGVSAAIINAFVNVIKVLKDAGHDLGSAIRRIGENNICPLQ